MGRTAADIRQLQEVPEAPAEAVLLQPGVQRHHGQVDVPALRRGSAYRWKFTSMFRFQAWSSPSQCHQFRSPAWKTVRPSAVTRKATPSSVEGRVSTVTPGRGAARSPPPRKAPAVAAASSERPQRARFRSVRRMSLPSRKRTSRCPSSREKMPGIESGLRGGGWQRPAGACPPAGAAGRPSTSQRAARDRLQLHQKAAVVQKGDVHHRNFTAVP